MTYITLYRESEDSPIEIIKEIIIDDVPEYGFCEHIQYPTTNSSLGAQFHLRDGYRVECSITHDCEITLDHWILYKPLFTIKFNNGELIVLLHEIMDILKNATEENIDLYLNDKRADLHRLYIELGNRLRSMEEELFDLKSHIDEFADRFGGQSRVKRA